MNKKRKLNLSVFMLKTKIISFFVFFSLPLIYELKVHANFLADYVSQESEEVAQRRAVKSGSRSNCKSDIVKDSVSLLIPKEQVYHHTSVKKPSFFLIANNLPSTKTFKFTLVDPKRGKTLVEKKFSISKGIKQIKVPKSIQLELDRRYLWHVAIPCRNNPEKSREVLKAGIKRIEPNQKVKIQLNQAKSDLETAAIYAQSGFWYEALEIAVKERNQDRKDNKVNHSDFLERLLHSAEAN